MENENLIPVADICRFYNIETGFLEALNECGLVSISGSDAAHYVHREEIQPLEMMIRLHYELDINLEGIEAIAHLLQRVESLQEELRVTRNKLKRFEYGG